MFNNVTISSDFASQQIFRKGKENVNFPLSDQMLIHSLFFPPLMHIMERKKCKTLRAAILHSQDARECKSLFISFELWADL